MRGLRESNKKEVLGGKSEFVQCGKEKLEKTLVAKTLTIKEIKLALVNL